MNNRVLLTVSGTIDANLASSVEQGLRPRADYVELASALRADLLDNAEAARTAGRFGRIIQSVAGNDALLAWACFRRRKSYDAIVTDGEQVGLPYALLCRGVWRRSRPKHCMIVHVMSVPKKMLLFKTCGLRRRIDLMFVYSSWQKDFALAKLGMRSDQVVLTSFMVDTRFFRPHAAVPAKRRMIASAGLEFRDYETLVDAVRGLDVELVIAAASPWSKRSTKVISSPLPANVTVCRLGFVDLRQLYADSLFVVMPLHDVKFQAGVTTILEAMAMERAVICSSSVGQTDVIINEETGLYVPPGDVAALRQAIERLLRFEDLAMRLGQRARMWVSEHAEIAVYADHIASAVSATMPN